MRIQLHADYRGVLTDEVYYVAGEYGDDAMPPAHMKALIEAGRADAVKPAKTTATKRTRRTRKKASE